MGTKQTVLIADDDPGLVDLYATWLETEYDVRTAYGGAEALAIFDEDVDIALIDRRMPDRSGDEVLETVRKRGLDCRIAMVTAVEPNFDILEMGFDEYVVKPVDERELFDVVEALSARAAYDETLQRLFALVSKRSTLESNATEKELAESDAYAELTGRIEALEAEIEATIRRFDDRDFEAELQKVTRTAGGSER